MQSPSLDQRPQALCHQSGGLPISQFLHRIHAGFPSPAADYEDEALDLNAYLINNQPSTFIFTVKGDSMLYAGILDGDKAVVDRAKEARHGHIVVAVVNGEYTLKRLYCRNGRIELRPENPAYHSIVIGEGMELHIWAVLIGLLRRYPR